MFDKLFTSITMIDVVICGFGMVAGALLIISIALAKGIQNGIIEWKKTNNPETLSFDFKYLIVIYDIFLAIISIFPLLGMFGTVMGLLNVDFTAGNMDDVKTNFFTALTSTAWGIIFSIGFKLINSFFSSHIETQIEESKKLAELLDIKKKKKKKNR